MRGFVLRSLAGGAALALTALAAPAPASAPSEAAAPRPEQAVEHRAAVVVDTGGGVRYGCVRFTAETISAKDALEQAAMDPVFQEFGGSLGSAVCALCGTGCPVGSCLTCAAQVWSYWRQPAGSGGYTFSSVGVSNIAVHDGDIEGWVWGRTGPPPGISIENVCGPDPVPPGPAPVPDGGGAAGPVAADPGATGGPAGAGGTGGTRGGPADPTATGGSATEETPGAADGGTPAGKAGKDADGKGRRNDEQLTAAAGDEGDGGGGGGPPTSLIGLLALLAVLAGAGLWIRHVRRPPAPN